MCGIAGIVGLSGQPLPIPKLLRMMNLLQHRGPDGDGWIEDDGVRIRGGAQSDERETWSATVARATWSGRPTAALGHRRLAITDLSQAASQPMGRSSHRYWITFNGAIYNAPELRRELEGAGDRFASASDTEVLLAALIRWGPAALERLNGMWAFALWDTVEGELFCARDRFGVKPFYYLFTHDRRCVFA